MSGIIELLVMAGWGVGLLVFVGVLFDLSRRRDREAAERQAAQDDDRPVSPRE